MGRNRGAKAREKATLRTLSRADLRPDDYERLSVELSQGTDRSAALIGGSMLESRLTRVISSRLADSEGLYEALFEVDTAPLGTFAAKIKIGLALAIYNKPIKDVLETIRHIRNVFAHAMRPISFSEPELIREIAQLTPNIVMSLPGGHHIDGNRGRYLGNCFLLSHAFDKEAIKYEGRPIDYAISDFPEPPASR